MRGVLKRKVISCPFLALPRSWSKALTKLLCYECYERKARRMLVAKISNVMQVTKLDLRFRGPELMLKVCCNPNELTPFAIFTGENLFLFVV